MLKRLRNRQRGFTLIELLIVVAIIGIIAALLIPNFLDALQKAKQKRTVADVRNVGTAEMSWLTDQIAAGAAGVNNTVNLSSYTQSDQATLASLMIPQYIQEVPLRDGWKTTIDYYLTTNFSQKKIMLTRSYGQKGSPDSDAYTAGAFEPTDYEQDIVWADGFFVRWPQKVST
jgi:prepilin-type N-terminal cleavage/methylation domain-containing protein